MKLPLVIALLFFSFACFAGELTGKVVRVIDGDTITVIDADKKAAQDSVGGDRYA